MFLTVITRGPGTDHLHLQYLRITFSRLSLVFFTFSTLYCIVQGVIQSLLINTDLGADNLLGAILHEAQVPQVNVPWHIEDGNHTMLKICSHIPGATSYDSCATVYDSDNAAQLNANWSAPVGYRRAVRDAFVVGVPLTHWTTRMYYMPTKRCVFRRECVLTRDLIPLRSF